MFSPESGQKPLSAWERGFLLVLLVLAVLFGGLVELRSAFLSRRMGDVDCYFRAAWAVRTGADLYNITDNNNWHYNYPPMLAILMVPLADPPPGADQAGMTPYPVSVAIWYLFSLACLLLAVHWLARAVEKKSTDPGLQTCGFGSRRWWALRLLPILVCLVPAGHTLMRGQVNMLVLLLFAGMIASLLQGHSLRAGLCLAGTISIKLYPALLLIYPLWRRDWRMAGGCVVGLLLGLIVLPVAVFGPRDTLRLYQSYTEVLIKPALGTGTDTSRAHELTHVVATDSQSLQAAIHNTLYPDRAYRPRQPAAWVLAVHWLIGGIMTLLTLWAAGRHRHNTANTVLTIGALLLVMLLLSPVCHLHYFVFAIPLVMGLLAQKWEQRENLGWGLAVVFVVNFIANMVPNFPGMELWRDVGLAMYGALLFWLVAVLRLRNRPAAYAPEQNARLAA